MHIDPSIGILRLPSRTQRTMLRSANSDHSLSLSGSTSSNVNGAGTYLVPIALRLRVDQCDAAFMSRIWCVASTKEDLWAAWIQSLPRWILVGVAFHLGWSLWFIILPTSSWALSPSVAPRAPIVPHRTAELPCVDEPPARGASPLLWAYDCQFSAS